MAVPRHVALIMDGNGRWAQNRGKPRVYGHIRGASRIRPLVESARKHGIQALSLYAFSTENWSRPEEERSVLWKILIKFLQKEVSALDENNVKLNVLEEFRTLVHPSKKHLVKRWRHFQKTMGFF